MQGKSADKNISIRIVKCARKMQFLEAIGEDLTIMAPYKILHLDLTSADGKDILIIKDKTSNWIQVKNTDDHTLFHCQGAW